MSHTTQTLEESAYERFLGGPFGVPISVDRIHTMKTENGLKPGDFFVTWHEDRAALFMADSVDSRLRQVRAAGTEPDFNLEDCHRVEITGCWQGGRKLSADYAKIAACPVGCTVTVLNGLVLRRLNKELEPGDDYIAERNTGPRLLTVRHNNTERRWIEPEERLAYAYDTVECIPVEWVGIV